LKFALRPVCKMGGGRRIGPTGKRRGRMLAGVAFVAHPDPSIRAGNERQW
jgi:hypothetical protein